MHAQAPGRFVVLAEIISDVQNLFWANITSCLYSNLENFWIRLFHSFNAWEYTKIPLRVLHVPEPVISRCQQHEATNEHKSQLFPLTSISLEVTKRDERSLYRHYSLLSCVVLMLKLRTGSTLICLTKTSIHKSTISLTVKDMEFDWSISIAQQQAANYQDGKDNIHELKRHQWKPTIKKEM